MRNACWSAFVLLAVLGTQALAALPIPATAPALPDTWGAPAPAVNPRAVKPTTQARPEQLVPLGPVSHLARMPEARLYVGKGRIDPSATFLSGQSFFYTVHAQRPGILEYLFSANGIFRSGQPLVRIYDPKLLPDLQLAESAMSRFAGSPFVLARSSSASLLPPPNDFPKPTVWQRLLGIKPRAQVAQATQTTAPRPSLAREASRSGLQRSTGVAATSAAGPVPSVQSLSQTTGQLSELNARLGELTQSLARQELELRSAQDTLSQAREDSSARQRLYKQGVLARNSAETAQARVAELEEDLQVLQRRYDASERARDQINRQLEAARTKLDEDMSARARQATAPRVATNTPNRTRRTTRQVVQRPPARTVKPNLTSQTASFPSPTVTPRTDLRAPTTASGRLTALRTTPEVPMMPDQVKHLSAPRWFDQPAVSAGSVVNQLTPSGTAVVPGQPLLQVSNRDWVRLYADIAQTDLSSFPKGAPVALTFDEYPGVLLDGWVNAQYPVPGTDMARVEMVVVCREGYYPNDSYASMEWLALAAPLADEDERQPLQHALQPVSKDLGLSTAYSIFPLVPPGITPASKAAPEVSEREFVGIVRLGETEQAGGAAVFSTDPRNAKRLAALRQWRESFTAGMTTSVFGQLALTYPRNGEMSRAIERLATAQVSHVPNRCAGTMREALGWGLGDAAMWMQRLPERGYQPRKDGLARPGDILVWPFTYGSRHTQHIGVAVSQGGKLMLLSNLSGTLGTSELQPGYLAFYYPSTRQLAQAKPPAKR